MEDGRGFACIYLVLTNNAEILIHQRKFDAFLRGRDPSWGVRDLEAVMEQAKLNSLEWKETIDMPANNLSVVFEKK